MKIYLLLGWAIVLMTCVVFGELVGMIRGYVYREKTFSAEVYQRGMKEKSVVLILLLLVYLQG